MGRKAQRKKKRQQVFVATTRMPESACPVCHSRLDAATGAGFDKPPIPEPGDVTQCGPCGTVLVFTESLDLRLATQAEWNELPPEFQKLLADMKPLGKDSC
jgi:hypothetical protein